MQHSSLMKVGAVSTSLLAAGGAVFGLTSQATTPATAVATGTQAVVAQQEATVKVANVQGDFAFNQSVVTPTDGVFSLYGTIMTGMCGSTEAMNSEGEVNTDYWINVGGSVERAYSISPEELIARTDAKKVTITCSCGSTRGIANAAVSGISLESVAEMAGITPDVNTVTFTAADGYRTSVPLQAALDAKSLIVYEVNGEDLIAKDGGSQLWMPNVAASYFTRQVVDIEFSAEEEMPEIYDAPEEFVHKVGIMNFSDDAVFIAGQPIVFEGYADDYKTPIAAVEFSLDGGETWTTCEVKNASRNRWVYWNFFYTPEESGTYELMARSVTAEGFTSPLSASMMFTVM